MNNTCSSIQIVLGREVDRAPRWYWAKPSRRERNWTEPFYLSRVSPQFLSKSEAERWWQEHSAELKRGRYALLQHPWRTVITNLIRKEEIT